MSINILSGILAVIFFVFAFEVESGVFFIISIILGYVSFKLSIKNSGNKSINNEDSKTISTSKNFFFPDYLFYTKVDDGSEELFSLKYGTFEHHIKVLNTTKSSKNIHKISKYIITGRLISVSPEEVLVRSLHYDSHKEEFDEADNLLKEKRSEVEEKEANE